MLAGTRKILEAGRKLLGAGRTGDEGTSRIAHTWIADPDRIRQLATGQAAYIRHGGATFINVTPAPAHRPRAPRPAPAHDPQPRRLDAPTLPLPILPSSSLSLSLSLSLIVHPALHSPE